MKKILRILGKGLLILAAVLVVFGIFLVLYNLRDDSLDPEVEKLLAAAPPQIPAAENGYFAWVGVVGPEDQSPHAWGSRWYQAALVADKMPAGKVGQPAGEFAIDTGKRKDGLRAEDFACNKIDSCLEAVAARPDEARAILAKGHVALARGDVAVAFPRYQEAWRPDFSVASYLPSYANSFRQLSATRFALAVAENRDDEALTRLGREMAFHTRQMQGAVTLIEKLVAMASLRADTELLSQYIARKPDAARQRADRLASLLAPLPTDATRMQAVILTELRMVARLFLSMVKRPDLSLFDAAEGASGIKQFLGRALWLNLYLPNASANEHVRLYNRLLAADGLSDDAYRRALADSRQQTEAAAQNVYVLRNPLGHILVSIAIPNYGSYFLRRDDLVAQRAMAAFQLDLLRKNVTDADAIAQALPAAGLIHPHTGAAPVWDKTTRTLGYAPLPERSANKALSLHF
jgi:hypothetical protein